MIDGERFADAGDNIVPEPPTAIVFYNPDEEDGFTRQARDEAERLEKAGHTVQMIAITSAQQFMEDWNSIDDSIVEHVSIITHGGPHAIDMIRGNLVAHNSEYAAGLSDEERKNNVFVEDLETKNLNVDLLSCNSGHRNHDDNITNAFQNLITGTATGWDGNLSFYITTPVSNGYGGYTYLDVYCPRLSFDQSGWLQKNDSCFGIPYGRVFGNAGKYKAYGHSGAGGGGGTGW